MSCCENTTTKVADPLYVWHQLQQEAQQASIADAAVAPFMTRFVLNHRRLEEMVAYRLADRLSQSTIEFEELKALFFSLIDQIGGLAEAIATDIQAVVDRDPATNRFMEPGLYLKGFQAIQTHRFAHQLWLQGRKDSAYYLQSQSSSIFQTDIHPAARIGVGVFLDHATGLVVGETAVVEDNVSMLQDVTLGGTGKDCEDRHPKIRQGVLIGAGAKVLGNIEVGECAKIAACSVVLKPVPSHATVAGVPARIVGKSGHDEPALVMDQVMGIGEGI